MRLPACGHWPWMNSTAECMGRPIRALVDVHSGAVWASTSPVGVDAESWTLVLWELEEQGLHWDTTVSDGGRAIEEAVGVPGSRQAAAWEVSQNGCGGTCCRPGPGPVCL